MLPSVQESEPGPAERRQASPGCLGYGLAVAVSLVILALELATVDAIETGVLHDFLDVVVVVIIFGAVPAAIIGSVGVLAVHLLTRWTTSQLWAVSVAAAAGFVAGLLVYRDDLGPVLMLALATGIGRAAVVPLVTERRAPVE